MTARKIRRASKLDWVLVGPVLLNDAPLSNH
jgi:hypothetical protein